MKKFFKVLIIAFTCFTIAMVTGTYIFVSSISKGQSYNDEKITNEDKMPEKKERVNVLVVGVDAKDEKASKTARTDTMMLATFDPNTEKVDVISIPRDTRVLIRGRKGKDKINHAHAYEGIDLSMKAVKDLLGVPIHYYVRINYTGVAKIIDDIGGVEVDVPINMNYYDPKADPPLKINLKKGVQVLDSDKSMQFLRFRKGKNGTGYPDGDIGRINAQHNFLMALSDKLLSPKTIIRLPKLLSTFITYVDTNMSVSQISSYALYAKDIKREDIHMVTIPGTPKMINGISYYEPDMKNIEKMIEQIFSGNYETKKSDNSSTTNDMNQNKNKKKVTVEVLNGANINGLATKIGKQLKEEGYDVVKVGNVEGIKYTKTHIYDRKNKESDAKHIAKILGVKQIESDIHTDTKVDITIIVGADMKQ
ncbi:LCP family protein [Inediibacterium massiliense]|uniref:LCP family protein n=1 Tax=Inediibacterium massiliense TaxID=1658111 RepID=UPI0006B5E789|nr:LCP family protein [Inediibacterium massiliense]